MKLNIPCRFSTEGFNTFKEQREGIIVGESRDKRCWRVRWEDNLSVYTYAKSFIHPIKDVCTYCGGTGVTPQGLQDNNN